MSFAYFFELEDHVHLGHPETHVGHALAGIDVFLIVVEDILGLDLEVLVGRLESFRRGGDGLLGGVELNLRQNQNFD